MTDTTTLHVRIESTDEFHEAVLENLSKIDADEGETIEEPHVLSLPDEEALSRVLSPTNVELLRAVVNGAPESMRETARLVDRDIKDVSRNLHELHELGLVEFEQEGRSKRPVVEFDRIEIDVPILSETGGRPEPADV
ncbi:MAG: hypothetical protein ABEH65_03785 [Halobacteriales archaeon]